MCFDCVCGCMCVCVRVCRVVLYLIILGRAAAFRSPGSNSSCYYSSVSTVIKKLSDTAFAFVFMLQLTKASSWPTCKLQQVMNNLRVNGIFFLPS